MTFDLVLTEKPRRRDPVWPTTHGRRRHPETASSTWWAQQTNGADAR